MTKKRMGEKFKGNNDMFPWITELIKDLKSKNLENAKFNSYRKIYSMHVIAKFKNIEVIKGNFFFVFACVLLHWFPN